MVRYVYGKLDSTLTAYYDFGGIYFTTEYADGSRNGITRVFAPDGTPILEKRYRDGAIIEVRTTGKNGQFGEWKPFSANINIVAYYPNGTKSYEEEYTAGNLSNARRIYFPDGKLCMEYHYIDGENDGSFVVNYPTGKTCLKGQYRLGEMDGILEVFQENGMPLKTITYKMGSKIGPTTIFKNGVKSKEIIYFGYPVK
jgi:antitoxin component YwqK of YwqJK toxin-antitoxin module